MIEDTDIYRLRYSWSGPAERKPLVYRSIATLCDELDSVRFDRERLRADADRLRHERQAALCRAATAERQVARLTAALGSIDDVTECSSLGQCFEAFPDDPTEWCVSCTAHVAVTSAPAAGGELDEEGRCPATAPTLLGAGRCELPAGHSISHYLRHPGGSCTWMATS